jgi:branched-chain amino acid transport system ATP-binding protein
MTLLSVGGLVKRYGSVTVLDDVSFDIAPGEAVGIVGPNGAGKTTLLDIVAGAQRADRGTVTLDGTNLTRLTPARRCRRGVARTFQTPRPLGQLTVFETALVGAVRGGGLRGRRAHAAAHRALVVTDTLRLGNDPSASLRLLDRKRLELARALATQPRVLLLDEIAGGLTDVETAALVDTVGAVHAAGTTVVWVEHIIRALVRVASRLICLADGRVLADGAPAEVLESPEVRSAYFGRSPN